MLHIRPFNRFILISLVLLGLSVSSASAATLTVVGGELQGATGVLVGGISYNVSFEDGSCISLFGGCDEAADFTFHNSADADSASAALLTQVFDGGAFADDTNVIRGIDTLDSAHLWTPWELASIGGIPAVYSSGAFLEGAGVGYDVLVCSVCLVQPNADLAESGFATYAIWTPVSAVPVPAAVWLFGTALIGFVGVARKRKVG